nr:RNA-directed DNA polymerase, eukaryota, reverse transcriptase zinc-binding domain protein [Tanacetum cinerariifolium]
MFDHNDDQCPKKVNVVVPNHVSDDGFVEVTHKHGKGKQNSKPKHIDGVQLTKPKPNYYYRPATNAIGSKMDDSDSEKVENVFVEDNGKHMDDLVDDARKKVEAPPKKTPRETSIWSGRKAS